MFEQMINFLLEDEDFTDEEREKIYNAFKYNEKLEILSTISSRKNKNLVDIERIPSNYTMSLCHCAGCYDSKNETADKLDFSKDVLLTD
jgi:hypothetical protein